MAETALAVIPLAALFNTCLRLFDNIITVRRAKADLTSIDICVQYEAARLSALQIVLLKRPAPSRPDLLIQNTLKHAASTLTEIHALTLRHASPVASSLDGGGSAERRGKAIIAGAKKPFVKAAWIGSDKARMQELMASLKEMNLNLRSLLSPHEQETMDYRLMARFIATENPLELEDISVEHDGEYADVTAAAELKRITVQGIVGFHAPEVHRYKSSVDNIEWHKSSLPNPARLPPGPISLAQVLPLNRAVGLLRVHDANPVPVLVEWRDNFLTHTTPTESEARLDRLVSMLSAMHEASSSTSTAASFASAPRSVDLSTLRPLGWVTSSSRLGLIFSFPHSTSPRPTSLRSKILLDRKRKDATPPALGLRFDLAYALAKALADLLTVGWIHKALRSDNVLFFDDAAVARLGRFYLVGFTFARPGDVDTKDLSRLPVRESSWALYRPPRHVMEKAGVTAEGDKVVGDSVEGEGEEPRSRITAAFDIYALGIILLEMGLWQTIDTLKGQMKREEFNGPRGVLSQMVDTLSYRMGDIYAGVVRRCLSLEDLMTEDVDEIEFMAQVLEGLGRCVA